MATVTLTSEAFGRPRERITRCAARAEASNHPVPYLFLGQFARRAQQPEASLEYLNAAASCPLPENWPESHRQRFLALLHMERFQLAQASQDTELARDALGQLLKLDPDNAKLQGIYDGLPAEQ